MSKGLEHLERVSVATIGELHQWLLENHMQQESVWLVTYKKIALDKYVSREEVLDELIAFGWIDGVRQAVDDNTTMQLISPRQTKPWAKSYKDRAERLLVEGRMQPSGLVSVALAKATGAWGVMDDVDSLVIPKDLNDALQEQGNAFTFFDNFPPSTKRNILRWISSAKTAETRNKRILKTVSEAKMNKRVASHG